MAIAAHWMTVATWVQVGIAVIGTGVAIVGTILLLRSLRYSRSATEAATSAANAAVDANALNRDAFVADQRAWIALKSAAIVSPITWQNNKGSISFRIHAKNIGQTPAFNVWVDCAIHINIEIQPHDAYAALAAKARQRKMDLGYTVFPGSDIVQDVGLQMSEDALNEYFARSGRDGWKEEIAVFPTLIGCIDYRLFIEGERRQTGFIYRIDRNPQKSDIIAIGPAFGDVPLEQLRLLQWPVGAGAIAD